MIVAGAFVVRWPLRVRGFELPRLATIGTLDVLGSSFSTLPTTLGGVSLVAAAASLYRR